MLTVRELKELLEGIIEWVPAPKGNLNAPLKANIFDSHFDPYKGVIMHVRVFDGELKVIDNKGPELELKKIIQAKKKNKFSIPVKMDFTRSPQTNDYIC